MKLPKSFTTVTPFSKALALFIFITFPIVAFYFGRATIQVPTYVNQNSASSPLPFPSGKQECGEFPQVASDFIPDDQEKQIAGNDYANPVWSRDCRYIAFNIFNTSYHPISSKMYLYRTQNQKIEEIKPPNGTKGSVVSYGKWNQSSCVEATIPVEGITGQVKIFYCPGDGYFSF